MSRPCAGTGCQRRAINGWAYCADCLMAVLDAHIRYLAERPGSGAGPSAGYRMGRESDGAGAAGGRLAPSEIDSRRSRGRRPHEPSASG